MKIMNIVLWILQVALALHTLMGAIWKFSNSEQTVDSLNIIPHTIWLMLGVIELFCFVALILPAFKKSLGRLAPIAAVIIAAEMLLYTGIHIYSGSTESYHIFYWLVVAAISAFIAYGRFVLKPIQDKQSK